MKTLTPEKHRTGYGFRSLFPDMVEFCWRCGRKLTGKKARERHFGPVCWRKHQAEQAEGQT